MATWWPFGKKKEEKKRGYAGAMYGRLVSDWMAQSTSMDSEIKGSLRALRNRSRQLARDNDYVRAFLREIELNVIGEGIPFQAQVKMQRGGKLNEPLNDQIETSWKKWTRKENCHVAGTLCFQDIERLLIRSTAESGEVFVRLITQSFGSSKVPLAMEIIESDRLDDEKSGRGPNGNEIRMGVEIDDWGRPVAYHFHEKHPGDYQFGHSKTPKLRGTTRIPAEEIIAIQRFERPGQTRSVPWMASAIMRLHHMDGFESATVIKARASAAQMGFITSDEGELRADAVVDNERLTDFQPGVFKYLAPGEKVDIPDMGTPNSQFDAFVRTMLRGFASGSGVSYESISADFSQTNYSSSRQALLKERDHYRVLQKWMIANFHQRVFERWLDLAVLSGELSLAGYEIAPERYQSVKWMPRGWAWVDPQKEAEAYKSSVRSGFMTLGDVVAQQGGDLEELMINRERELKMASDRGIILDTDPKFVSNAGLTQGRPAGTSLPSTEETSPDAAQSQPDPAFDGA